MPAAAVLSALGVVEVDAAVADAGCRPPGVQLAPGRQDAAAALVGRDQVLAASR